MKKFASIVCLAALLVNIGCGGRGTTQSLPPGIPGGGSPPPQPVSANESWHFTAQSTDSLALVIEAALLFDDARVSGIAHITDGSCFLFRDTIEISGSVDSNNKIHLVTIASQGSTVTIDATLSQDRLSMVDGTYKIDGGCADGYVGTISAARVNALDGHYNGTLSLGDTTIPVTADMTQAQLADPVSGWFLITGTLTMSGTQCAARFSLQGEMIGNYVALYSSSATGLEGLIGRVDLDGQQISIDDYLYSDDCTAGYVGVLQRQ